MKTCLQVRTRIFPGKQLDVAGQMEPEVEQDMYMLNSIAVSTISLSSFTR